MKPKLFETSLMSFTLHDCLLASMSELLSVVGYQFLSWTDGPGLPQYHKYSVVPILNCMRAPQPKVILHE